MNESIQAMREKAWECPEECDEGILHLEGQGLAPTLTRPTWDEHCFCGDGTIEEQGCEFCADFVVDTDKHGVTYAYNVCCTACLEDPENLPELRGIVPATS